MKIRRKVIAIGLDAAEPSLIEKWMDEGYLKNLASLRARGSYGRLNSSADWLVGSTWPTFYTSTLPGKHGFYHYLQWKGDQMDYDRPNPEWIDAVPFWQKDCNNCRVIAVDIPLARPRATINGIEISGYALHDRIFPISSYPKEKIDWVIKNFGKPPISDEIGGLQEMSELLKLRDEMINANRKEGELITSLIRNEEWDLFLGCFSSTHRGGHKFWKATNIKGKFSEEQKREFDSALRDIYKSCDEEVGKITSSISNDVSILVFALHGMGVNTTLSDKILPQMLSRIINDGEAVTNIKKSGFVRNMRNAVPLEWRAKLRGLLPYWLQDKMTAYWRMGGIEWSNTRVFSLVADLQGYIRINLIGREREGIVAEGEEYNQVCEKVIGGLKTFKDEDSLEPIVESVYRSEELYEKGAGFNNLPDIVVNWKSKPAIVYKRIISEKYGAIECPFEGRNIDGRSGNHRAEGFLIAVGEKFKKNSTLAKKHHIIDLAPTILNILDIKKPQEMDGESII
jgi:predicted AlkP superfamily phosphohydrolase/phosphomutase